MWYACPHHVSCRQTMQPDDDFCRLASVIPQDLLFPTASRQMNSFFALTFAGIFNATTFGSTYVGKFNLSHDGGGACHAAECWTTLLNICAATPSAIHLRKLWCREYWIIQDDVEMPAVAHSIGICCGPQIWNSWKVTSGGAQLRRHLTYPLSFLRKVNTLP